jgi:hypothetical protein
MENEVKDLHKGASESTPSPSFGLKEEDFPSKVTRPISASTLSLHATSLFAWVAHYYFKTKRSKNIYAERGHFAERAIALQSNRDRQRATFKWTPSNPLEEKEVRNWNNWKDTGGNEVARRKFLQFLPTDEGLRQNLVLQRPLEGICSVTGIPLRGIQDFHSGEGKGRITIDFKSVNEIPVLKRNGMLPSSKINHINQMGFYRSMDRQVYGTDIELSYCLMYIDHKGSVMPYWISDDVLDEAEERNKEQLKLVKEDMMLPVEELMVKVLKPPAPTYIPFHSREDIMNLKTLYMKKVKELCPNMSPFLRKQLLLPLDY